MSQVSTEFRAPAYERVRRGVLRLIADRNLKPGDRLPSERALAESFDLNHRTVRNGLADLVSQRIIERRVGAGTFVTADPMRVHELIRESNKENVPEVLFGVLVPSRMDLFAAELLGHLNDQALAVHSQLAIRTVEDLGQDLIGAGRGLVAQGAAGLILPWRCGDEAQINRALLELARNEVPVSTSWVTPGAEQFCCESPTVCGKYCGTPVEFVARYFAALGYKHIAFLGPDAPVEAALHNRAVAYSRFMSRLGKQSHIGFVNRTAKDVSRVAQQWQSMAGDLAVICYDDEHALRLMTAAIKLNLRIPEDIAIVGVNNIPMGEMADPPLTTVPFDFDYLATALIRHLHAQLRGQSSQLTVPWPLPQLIIRESCGGRIRMGDQLDSLISRISVDMRESDSVK